MVDVLLNPNEAFPEESSKMSNDWVAESATENTEEEETVEDVEEGELPEEGEITDDEDATGPVPLNKIDAKLPDKENTRRTKRNSHSSTSSSRHSKPTKYKDHDPKATKSARDGEMVESWANGAHRAAHREELDDRRARPERRDVNGDVDLRDTEADRRIRRRSSSPNDGHLSPKRLRHDSPPSSMQLQRPRRGPVKTEWTERTICKFFREGFCRDGDQCVYSHNAADSRRIPELCRYYQHGYCKKNVRCLNLHGEFPCKAFHTDGCRNEECRFSHQPLNDYTQPIFDQMMKDAELAEKISQLPRTQRRVLLPEGPEEFDAIYDFNVHNVSLDPLPAPTVVVPVLANAAPSQATYGFFNAVPTASNSSPHQKPFSHTPTAVSSAPVRNSPQLQSPPPREEGSAPLSINDLLGQLSRPVEPMEITPEVMNENIRSLQSMFDCPPVIDESPASPPPEGVIASDSAPVIPTNRPYRAIPILINDNQLDLNLIQDLTSGIHKSDPRLKRVAEKQFDLVSQSLQLGGMLNMKPDQTKDKPLDPRSRDPRMRSGLNSSPPGSSLASSLNSTLAGLGPGLTSGLSLGLSMNSGLSSGLSPDMSTSSFTQSDREFEQKVSQQLRMASQLQQGSDMDFRGGNDRYETSPRYDDRPFDGFDRRYSNRSRDSSYRSRDSRDPRPKRDFDDRYDRKRGYPSPRQDEPKQDNQQPSTQQPLTLREKRKDNIFESPLAKTSRF
ncbi:unnamed protein product [Bursaphelenchus xylophilus]|uniref:(pine wood nematode) hypothetical protein n=1 Tax=Bursaphelenchus xylophilus TaxID=6326 RepID=A0A1I7RJ26_BURXY|nr:unnamed protein product [Bursaphelenchus xylophilus]CAG9119282.1 unnamed protein product [Bursaphelenchus xylophilus]